MDNPIEAQATIRPSHNDAPAPLEQNLSLADIKPPEHARPLEYLSFGHQGIVEPGARPGDVGVDYLLFSVSIYVAATAVPDSLDKVPIAIVDEDASPLSARFAAAFYLPRFNPPANISLTEIDAGMAAGNYSFVVDIPPRFSKRRAGRSFASNSTEC